MFYPNNTKVDPNRGRRGIYRKARVLFSKRAGVYLDTIIAPSIEKEGGGYDAINTYDRAYLSVGLNQWTWEELYNLLWNALNDKAVDFKSLFNDYGLDINNVHDIKRSDLKLINVDGIDYKLNPRTTAVKKLKFVYCFIKAASDKYFQSVQNNKATTRIAEIRDKIKVLNVPIYAYTTSEIGTALVLDQHINVSGAVQGSVEKAVNGVISRLKSGDWNAGMLAENRRTSFKEYFRVGNNNMYIIKSLSVSEKERFDALVSNPANWGQFEEDLFIIEYKKARINSTMTNPVGRAEYIENSGLKRDRGSFRG